MSVVVEVPQLPLIFGGCYITKKLNSIITHEVTQTSSTGTDFCHVWIC